VRFIWEQVRLPYVCERLIAFSIPEGGEFLVLSYEGLHRIRLAPEVSVWTDPAHAEDYDIYDTECGVLSYGGRRHWMLGFHGGEPVGDLPGGERLELDPGAGRLSVTDRAGRPLAEVGDFDLSEDWACATFSIDGNYIVVGTPNELRVYRRARGACLTAG
jgi:hypothetical protein